jgi:hypothetical protein
MHREAVSSSGKQETTEQQQDGGTSMSTGTDSEVDMVVQLGGAEVQLNSFFNTGTYVRYAPADLPLGKEASESIEYEVLIQGDSGGKVNILGGDSIGHCEVKSSFEHACNSEWLPTEGCLNVQTLNNVNSNNGRGDPLR